MKLLKNISWNVINEYLEKDLLIIQKHPTKDLWILNYSKTCQYSRAWDEVTLSCRGLVVNGAGTIVARPFVKFFNKEEHEARVDIDGMFTDGEGESYLNSSTVGEIPKDLSFEVFEKMDGSLGLLFYYDGEWIFASRGSFTSEQAIKGGEMFKNISLFALNINTPCTYIFEIIYPENRIVIDYGSDEDLVLLGVIVTETGEELPYDMILHTHYKEFSIVPRYDGIEDFTLLKGMEEDNKEGFVVLFSNGFRMKVKFEEYCRLHAIVTNVSNKIIWKYLMDGESFEDLLDRVPDEFYDWVLKTKNELEDAYRLVERTCHGYMGNTMIDLCKLDRKATKKDFALAVKGHKYSGILFSIWDKKDYSEAIWKLVKPVYGKPFKDGVDES